MTAGTKSAKVKIRYLVSKGGRYYWRPKKADVEIGFYNESLGKDLITAIKKAQKLNKKLDDYRNNGILPYEQKDKKTKFGSVKHAVELYRKSRGYLELSPITQRNYETYLKRIDQRYGHLDIANLEKKHATKIYEKELTEYGQPRRAEDLAKVFGNVVKNAIAEGIYHGSNPFRELNKKRNPPRQEMWQEEDYINILDACDQLGYEGIKTAIMLSYWGGQRQTDILNMSWNDLKEGYWELKQSKTKAVVRIPIMVLKPLQKHLSLLQKKGLFVVCFNDKNSNIIKKYDRSLFDKHFRKARALSGVDQKLQFKDFRRTAVTKLAQAGCSVPEIASFTGHTVKSVSNMMSVYLSRKGGVSMEAGKKLMLKFNNFNNR